jgi:hypothetical protein
MRNRIAQLAGLTLLLGIVFVPSLHASPRFSFSVRVGPSGPMANYAVAPRPRSGYGWQPGYDRPYDRGNYDRRNYDRRNYDRENYHRENYDRNWDGHGNRDGRDGYRNERGNWHQ